MNYCINIFQCSARSLELHALGAAIPMCLSLALAITDALPCGQDGISTRITTGSEPVVDEIIPEEEVRIISCTTNL